MARRVRPRRMSKKTLYALSIAGGRGERLKPLTDSLPKPMVSVQGRPLISHQADIFVKNGVTDIIFLCGYMGRKIRDYFGDGDGFGFRAHYSFEDSPLGRGGAVRKGMELLPPDYAADIIVSNGDMLTAQPFKPILEKHNASGAVATLMLTPYPNTYGVVETDNNDMVASFTEKQPVPYWINGGLYVFSLGIKPLLPEIGDHETDTFPQLAEQRRLAAYKSAKTWMTVDNLKELGEAEKVIRSGILGV